MPPSKIQQKNHPADVIQAYGVSGIRRKSFAHNGVIFCPDLPPIVEEESDSSMDTEDEDVEDTCGVESFTNNTERDAEVLSSNIFILF